MCWSYKTNLQDTTDTVNLRFFKTNTGGYERLFVLTDAADSPGYQTLFTKFGAYDNAMNFFYLKWNTIIFRFRLLTSNFSGNYYDGTNVVTINYKEIEVWAMNVYGGGATDLTRLWDPLNDFNPAWSVAYTTFRFFGPPLYKAAGSMNFTIMDGDRMIRAAINTTYNSLWCIPVKPTASNYIDSEIGTLAPEEAYMQNRAWTDGKDPETPVYPEQAIINDVDITPPTNISCLASPDSCRIRNSCQININTNNQKFFYQLVYDKGNMAVATTTLMKAVNGNMTTSTLTITVASTAGFTAGSILSSDSTSALGLAGTSNVLRVDSSTQLTLAFTEQPLTSVATGVTIKLSMPKQLWQTAYLSRYFSNSTITEMRRYYCQEAFAADMTGETVEKKCFGYISARTETYVMLPMTVLSSRATMITS